MVSFPLFMLIGSFFLALSSAAIFPNKHIKHHSQQRYEPTWESLDSRPLPTWYDEAKIGIFIHWGVFSVIGYRSEWIWWSWKGAKDPDTVKFFERHFRPDITYADFAQQFSAMFYDPEYWADLFAASGARYVVLTSKHHEGYTMWPSNYSFNWNVRDVGPNRDLLGDLAVAVRKRPSLRFGLYHSLFEWFHPLYLQDKANNFQTRMFPEKKGLPELYELVNAYKPDVIWSDGDWEAPDTYWNSTGFISWLYNDSPVKDTVVTNDRWGINTTCKHGGYFTCMDKYSPGVLQVRKWEDAMTLDQDSWGYRRNMNYQDVLTIQDLIGTIASTISCGGNILINIGPTADGTIAPIFQERLYEMGEWLKVNADGIYATSPWSHQNDTVDKDIWYTAKTDPSNGQTTVYAIVLRWYNTSTVIMGSPQPSSDTTIQILGHNKDLAYKQVENAISVNLPPEQEVPAVQDWGYVLRLTNLKNPPEPKEIMPLPERFRKNLAVRSRF